MKTKHKDQISNPKVSENTGSSKVADTTALTSGKLMSKRLIKPEDLNPAGRLFGGRVMEWIDEVTALFCMLCMSTRSVVTKKFSEVVFNQPADLGDILEFQCRISHVGKTSLTVVCRVTTDPISSKDISKLIVECEVVFVCLGPNGKPAPHGYKAALAQNELK